MLRPPGPRRSTRPALHGGERTDAVGQPSARPLARINHHTIFQGDQRIQLL
jgi:hypothetical protein